MRGRYCTPELKTLIRRCAAPSPGGEGTKRTSPRPGRPATMTDRHPCGLPVDQLHEGDCVENLGRLADGSIDLVFADPPFNIGYDTTSTTTARRTTTTSTGRGSGWRQVHRVLKPDGTFWLAIGDEYAAELKMLRPSELGFHMPQLGHLVLHVRRELQSRSSAAVARASVPLREGPARSSRSARRADNRVPSARQLVYADSRANPQRAGCRTTPGSCGRRTCRTAFTPTEDTWYFPALPARSRSAPAFTAARCRSSCSGRIIRVVLAAPARLVLDPFARQRHDARRRQEARPPLPRLRALPLLRLPHPRAAGRRFNRSTARRSSRAESRGDEASKQRVAER